MRTAIILMNGTSETVNAQDFASKAGCSYFRPTLMTNITMQLFVESGISKMIEDNDTEYISDGILILSALTFYNHDLDPFPPLDCKDPMALAGKWIYIPFDLLPTSEEISYGCVETYFGNVNMNQYYPNNVVLRHISPMAKEYFLPLGESIILSPRPSTLFCTQGAATVNGIELIPSVFITFNDFDENPEPIFVETKDKDTRIVKVREESEIVDVFHFHDANTRKFMR